MYINIIKSIINQYCSSYLVKEQKQIIKISSAFGRLVVNKSNYIIIDMVVL